MLGNAARSAGWGMARCLNPSRIARPSPRTCIRPYLLSASHPALRCPADRWVTKQTGYIGDSRSWFGFVRRRAVGVSGDSEAAQSLLFRIDQADGRVVEADQPLTVLGLHDRDGFARERDGDGDEIAPPSDFAVRAHPARRRLGRIVRVCGGHGLRSGHGLIDAGRSALAERFMRPLFIIVAGEMRETA